MAAIATNAMSQTTHAAAYHRVVIRLLMTCLLLSQKLATPTQVTRRRKRIPAVWKCKFEYERRWQGRKCVNSPHSSLMSQDLVPATKLGGGACRLSLATSSTQLFWNVAVRLS